MERNKRLTEKVKKFCRKVGIDIVGFADTKLFDRFPENNRPQNYLKGSQTVIILGFYLHDIILDAWNQNQKTGKSYHFADAVLENYCNLVKSFIKKQGYDSKIISYSPGLFLKDSAALAGIGPVGKNNLLITEHFGSQVRLRALTTTAPLVCGTPIFESKYCKDCNICIESCPASAFPDGKYNKDICRPYAISHLRNLSENTAIWCNICIESCPFTKIEYKKNFKKK